MARRVITDEGRRASRRSLLRGCLLGCITGILLCILVLGLMLYRLLQKPALPREELQRRQTSQSRPYQPPPPPLEQQIHEVERASKSGARVPVHLIVDQDQVNARMLQELAKGAPHEFSNPEVHFGDGTIAVTADWKWRSLVLHLTVRGKPEVQDGEVHVRITEARAGNIGVPAAAQQELQRRLDKALARQWPGIRIQSVSVTPGRLTADGVTVPR